MSRTVLSQMLSGLTVPWNAFVASFLYYTALAAAALGGASPSAGIVGVAYLVPVAVYLITLVSRLTRALGQYAAREVMHLQLSQVHDV